MKYLLSILVSLAGLGLAIGAPAGLLGGGGTDLRINPLYETTSWDLLIDMYFYQNSLRYYHGNSWLYFNRTLTDYARLQALIYAWYDGIVEEAGGDIHFGKNVHWANTTDVVTGSQVLEDWYWAEQYKWNYDAPKVTDETNEFSQIVWEASQEFGCGQAVSEGPNGGTYTVCYYSDIGNLEGQEGANVYRPRNTLPGDGTAPAPFSPSEARLAALRSAARSKSIGDRPSNLSPLLERP